ncbi:MAG: hypothetical protein IKO56_04840, partial [Alphaproteobacteria bacterium]|nr:hypothetical protein [Alphaproteobacteria bacterium]
MDLYDKTVAELQKTLDKLETPVAICSSQNEIIDQEQSWEYDVSIINAAMFASGYLSNHLNDDNFEWNRFVSDSSSFDDLNFRYKNNVFSVFIQIYYNGEELPIDYARKQKMLAIAKQNNHIPCVFPVNITDDTEEYRIWPAGGGANLFDLEMNTPLDPLKLASNKLVRRSKYDLLNGAIKTIWYHLEEQGFKPDYIYYDDPTLPADSVRLWFV